MPIGEWNKGTCWERSCSMLRDVSLVGTPEEKSTRGNGPRSLLILGGSAAGSARRPNLVLLRFMAASPELCGVPRTAFEPTWAGSPRACSQLERRTSKPFTATSFTL